MKPALCLWVQHEQCPCGDWQCSIKYEVDDQAQATQSTSNGTPSTSSLEFVFTPYVGQVFKSDDEAFEFYSVFARKNGFSIRKARSTESHNLGVYRRDFVCYRSGFNQPRKKANIEHPRERKSVRCGCDAKLYLTKDIANGISKWYVSQFSNVHNHELLDDDHVRLLPAYRKIQEADQERILLLSRAGFPVNRIIKVLELEKGFQPGQLPFIEKDIRNFVRSCKKTVLENDAHHTEKRVADMLELLEACKAMIEKDQDSAFEFTSDINGQVENVAWSLGDSVRAYSLFGDAVQFDVTYLSITYGLRLGVLSGIDSHGKPIFFGFAVLQEESPHAIAWALQTVIRLMRGRNPQTIVTDLDPGLRDLIASEFPNTKHVVSLQYIVSRLSSWFSLPLGIEYLEFKSEFEISCCLENTEDFEHHWNNLIARFRLASDKHIGLLSSFRESWAFSYIRDCFVARITTAEYMQALETCLKGILNVQTCLQGLFQQVGRAVKSGNKNKQTQFVHLKTRMPVEEHAQSTLTPYAFNVFQHELILSTQYSIREVAKGSYVVHHYKRIERERLLIWIAEDEQIHCSCKGFEHVGLLCRHAFRLLVTKNYFQVPDKFFPSRWRLENSLAPMEEGRTQAAKEGCYQALHSLTDTLLSESLVSKERFNFVRGELTVLLDHVKNMPADDIPPVVASNSFSEM